MKAIHTVTLAVIIQRLGTPPVGMTSLIAAPQSVLEAAKPMGQGRPTRAEVQERLKALRSQQETCGSDAAWWGYAGGISYLQALDNVLEAADLVGEHEMPDVPAPTYGGVLMDMMGQVEKYGAMVLQASKELAEARKAHPKSPLGTKQVELDMSALREHGQPLLDAVKAMEEKGLDEHVAVGLLLYLAGAIAAQRAVVFLGDRPLKDAVPPMWAGWLKGRDILLKGQPGPTQH